MGNRQLFDSKSPQQLLEEFKASGDNAPFEEIVRRYAAMVFGVCLRVTGDKHDAEDATQAVFLSLALQAKTSRQITYVGPWLQKVAHRLALDVKKSKTRRKRREERVADEARATNGNGRHFTNGGAFAGGNGHAMNPADAPGAEELKSIMMEELNQLPAKYRLPLVMHYFGGLSREEMSEQLGCNPSTLGVRVHRGKAMLGTRLAKRGIAISAIALAVLLEHTIRESAVAPIISTASAASNGLIAGTGIGPMLAASKVAMIVRSTARAVVYAKMKYAVVILLVITTTALASTTNVVQQIKNHLPSLNIGQWIKPLFNGWTPNLRVDATEDPLDTAPTIPAHDPELKIDPDRSLAPSRIVVTPAPSIPTQQQQPAVAKSAQPAPEPKLNATARAILAPNFAPPAVLPYSKVDSLKVNVDTQDAAAPDQTETPLASASTDPTFTLGLGAGGGASGKPDVYVMPENANLRHSSMTIGDAGFGVFHQTGGVNKVDGALTLGKQQGSKGVYEQTGGMLLAQREIIGDAGEGSYILQKGINRVEQSIIVGNTAGGNGSVQQSGGQIIVESKPGAPDGSKGVVLANAINSSAVWSMSGGSLDATPQYIGKGGKALFSQSGGTNVSGAIHIAADSGSVATYDQTGGQLVLTPVTSPDAASSDTPTDNPPIITVGDKGDGTFKLGDVVATGTVRETGQYGASVIVRGEPTAAGAIRGHGTVNLTGTLVMNGQTVADGFRHDETLDLSNFTTVTSTIENPAWAGTNGWFARRRGELKLPPTHVAQGTGTYTWGEFAGDELLDLVNSVRFKVENAHNEGDVSIALLSAIRTDIPTLPQGHHFIGVWSFDAQSLGGYDSVDFDIRYDDAAAASMDLDENILKLWRYTPEDGQWHRIMDDTFSRDVVNHIISGTAPGELTYFAVSAPEPTGATLLILGATALLARRPRRRPL